MFVTHLDDINSSNTGISANLVKCDKELKAVRICLITDSKLDWQTLLEDKSNINNFIWRISGIDSSSPHIIWRRERGIL